VQLRIHFVLVVLLCCGATSAQVDRLPSKVKISDTDLASCYEEATGKLLGSQLVRSHVLISPGGRYRAYTEVEAVASKSKASSDWDCASTSRLLVAFEDQPFRQVLVVEPSPESMGNSIGIVDWSPDGRTWIPFADREVTPRWIANARPMLARDPRTHLRTAGSRREIFSCWPNAANASKTSNRIGSR
jgi:hypothetical protein